MKKLRVASITSFVAAVAMAFVACQQVPGTGRSQLAFMPESQLASMAAEQFSAMQQEIPVSDNAQYTRMVREIGHNIAEAAHQRFDVPPADEWEIVVFDSEQVNAFAMPGGKIGVYTGLIELADGNRDEIASVMGHEVAHVLARHGNERVSQQIVAQLGMVGGQAALSQSDMSPQTQQLIMQGLGVGAQVGVMLPYSRKHESEADYLGLKLMAAAGYNPQAAVDFWRKMEARGGEAPPEFLSTHPAPGNRISALQNSMDEAMAIYRGEAQF